MSPAEAAARREIEEARNRWIAAIEAGDAAGFVDVVTDDAVWIVPSRPALSTRAGILEWLREPFRQFRYRYSVANVRLRVAGTWAVERAEFESHVTVPGGTPGPVHRGTYTLLWRPTEEGWRIHTYVDHTGWDPS